MKVQLGLYNQRFRIGVDVKVLPNRWEIRLTGDSRRLELPDGILVHPRSTLYLQSKVTSGPDWKTMASRLALRSFRTAGEHTFM